MSCKGCGETLEKEGIDPACWGGGCPALIDQLSDDAIRLLNIRGVLITLNELGLGAQTAKAFDLTQEDLFTLAWIEMEWRSLQPEPQPEAH